MSEVWYYTHGKEVLGPVSLQGLTDELARLPDRAGVRVWRPGQAKWEPAEKLSDIAGRPAPTSVAPSSSPGPRTPDAARRAAGRDEPVGFGGWLFLIGLGQAGSLVALATSTARDFSGIESHVWQALPLMWWGLLAMQIGYAVIVTAATVAYVAKSRGFPRLLIIQYVVALALVPLGVAWIVVTSGAPSSSVLAEFGYREIGHLARTFIAAAICIPYVLKSRRVANTFVY